jgi:hypothetical protein
VLTLDLESTLRADAQKSFATDSLFKPALIALPGDFKSAYQGTYTTEANGGDAH